MYKKIFFIICFMISSVLFSQSVIISTDNTTTADSSALLEIKSHAKGFLPPRLTSAERNAIKNPAFGLMIINSTQNQPQWYDSMGWKNLDGSCPYTPEELLSAHPWKIKELRYLYQNVLNHYERGVPGSVDYYVNESLQFNPNKTGVTNENVAFTWDFIDAAKTKLRLIINYSTGPLTVNWEHVVLKETLLTYSEYWTKSDGSSVGFGTRIPK